MAFRYEERCDIGRRKYIQEGTGWMVAQEGFNGPETMIPITPGTMIVVDRACTLRWDVASKTVIRIPGNGPDLFLPAFGGLVMLLLIFISGVESPFHL